jgi:aconitate hydratase
MSPEFGSTCAIFPIDAETLRYLEFSGRPAQLIELVEAYAKAQGLWHDEDSEEPTFTDRLELDLSSVVPSIAGPKRPQDRVSLTESKAAFRLALEGYLPDEDREDEAVADSFPASDPVSTHVPDGPGHEPEGGTGGMQVSERLQTTVPVLLADGTATDLDHGHVVIAAITSCTNTSNPSVMLGAGLLARNAVHRGLTVKPWVKTSLAPGSKVVTEYLVLRIEGLHLNPDMTTLSGDPVCDCKVTH